MNIEAMYNHFCLSGDEELSYSEQILPEGFRVDITLPDRVTNEEIADYFYHNIPYINLIGMNESVGDVVITVKTINDNYLNVYFNRGEPV